MRLIRPGFEFDFMRLRLPASIFSALLVVLSIILVAVRGLNFGIDFTGGTLIEVGYEQPQALDAVRTALRDGGFPEASVQEFGRPEDVLVRIAPREDTKAADIGDQVFAALSQASAVQLDLRRVEFVGPQVGEELVEDGSLAVIITLIAILIYVALRFEWRFAVGAVAALVHDVSATLGFFALTQLEFNLTVLAAVLAVVGYSLNDTIVVFDRVRENFRKMRKGTPIQIVNSSINQTMSRTIITSGTTLMVLFALLFLGGEVVRGFSLALIVGIFFGTYSTIWVATAIALALGVSKADLMPVQKEGIEDGRP